MELRPHTPKGRLQLSQVLSAGRDVIRIEDVQRTLELSRIDAAKRLSRWRSQGWIHRIGNGSYVPNTLDTLGAEQIVDDPWVLVPALFSPAYIGGRTAAEHWDLTEQIFKDVLVLTAQPIRQTRQVRHGTMFTLRHISETSIFGTKAVWRKRSRVLVSDVHRTVIDMLDEPTVGAGIQHVADCLDAYFKRADRDDKKLIEYASRLGNGAVFKRLGFLGERSGKAETLVKDCRERLTSGIAKLDTGQDNPRLISAWRLRVPSSWSSDGQP